jgi:hypothetical protein
MPEAPTDDQRVIFLMTGLGKVRDWIEDFRTAFATDRQPRKRRWKYLTQLNLMLAKIDQALEDLDGCIDEMKLPAQGG